VCRCSSSCVAAMRSSTNVVNTSAGVQREEPPAAAVPLLKGTNASPRLHFHQVDGLGHKLDHAGCGTARTLLVAARRRECLRTRT
jgi:hypothetical protein